MLLCTCWRWGSSAQALEASAPSALLMEKETGTVLFAKDEHAKLEPASVTKVMTLLLTMEAIDAGQLHYDDVVTASAHACSMGGSQIWLKENEQMTVSDMLKAVCVVSANDCAVALAETVAGSEEAFVERMNQRAAELGMADTHFCNATGLPAEGHVTSAYDIAPYEPGTDPKPPGHPPVHHHLDGFLRDGASSLVNTNRLIRFYQGATGLKTGSTDSALYCLSGTAERDGMELIAVIMKAPTSTQRFEDATNLLNYGFSTYTLENVVPESALPPVPVSLGTQATVQPVLGENTHLLLEKAKAGSLQQLVTLADSVEAPVAAGSQLGTSPSPPGKRSWRSCPSWQERRSHGSPSARCWSRCCGRPSSAADGGGGALHPLKSRRIATAFPCVPFRAWYNKATNPRSFTKERPVMMLDVKSFQLQSFSAPAL